MMGMDGREPETTEEPVRWVGSSRRDLRALPDEVRQAFGRALYQAQIGRKADAAGPLKGFGGAGVLEIVEDSDRRTYRAVYTVRSAGAVYVLHVFQKKSRHGVATPRDDLESVRERLKDAEQDYRARLEQGGS